MSWPRHKTLGSPKLASSLHYVFRGGMPYGMARQKYLTEAALSRADDEVVAELLSLGTRYRQEA